MSIFYRTCDNIFRLPIPSRPFDPWKDAIKLTDTLAYLFRTGLITFQSFENIKQLYGTYTQNKADKVKAENLVERYQNNNKWMCSDYVDLFSLLVQHYLPDVPVYAAGYDGHAVALVELGNVFYLFDPAHEGPISFYQWGNGWFTQEDARVLENVMSATGSKIDWSNLGYNPKASSRLALMYRFREAKFYALATSGLLGNIYFQPSDKYISE